MANGAIKINNDTQMENKIVLVFLVILFHFSPLTNLNQFTKIIYSSQKSNQEEASYRVLEKDNTAWLLKLLKLEALFINGYRIPIIILL